MKRKPARHTESVTTHFAESDDMSLVRLRWRRDYANWRWDLIMAHPAYKDDPEEHTFTAFEQYLYDMSNQWRLLVHRYENILDKKESRAGQTTITSPSNMVVFECEMNIAELSSLVFAKPDKAKG